MSAKLRAHKIIIGIFTKSKVRKNFGFERDIISGSLNGPRLFSSKSKWEIALDLYSSILQTKRSLEIKNPIRFKDFMVKNLSKYRFTEKQIFSF